MEQYDKFKNECVKNINELAGDQELKRLGGLFLIALSPQNILCFESLGRPIIQYPQDMVAIRTDLGGEADLIIETGIAHGGSLIMNASMLALLDICDTIQAGSSMDPSVSSRKVLGVDIDIRAHNKLQ